jgi:hypothetical protein
VIVSPIANLSLQVITHVLVSQWLTSVLASPKNPQISRVFATKGSYHSAQACSTHPESRKISRRPSSLEFSMFRQPTACQLLSCRGASNMNTRKLTTESQRQPHLQKHKTSKTPKERNTRTHYTSTSHKTSLIKDSRKNFFLVKSSAKTKPNSGNYPLLPQQPPPLIPIHPK